MPELPEVETTVNQLKKKVLGRTFIDIWTDSPKIIKKPETFGQFKKEIEGKKIQKVWRRGKNIIFDLSEEQSLLIHQKLTGHLLLGYWIIDDGCWKSKTSGVLGEKVNTYIHLLFTFDDGKMLALSDLRKFAKVELWKTKELLDSKGFKNLGPEPLDKSFTFEKFREVLRNKKGKIKQVLMNQEIIAGIGNIYSDEILWRAKIHPFKDVSKLEEDNLERIYEEIKKVLSEAVKLKGSSVADFRDIEGKKGKFGRVIDVYRKEGKKCPRCGTIVQRKKIGGRSAHFCPNCQIL